MKLAFLISAHTDAKHLARLVGSLPEESEFFVHIDAKSDIAPFIRAITDDRVHFLSHREDVIWGSWIEVRYQMELIRAALRRDTVFDYLITLSGMDYPLWSNARIVGFLSENRGKQFLQGMRVMKDDPKSHMYRQYRMLSCVHWKNGSIGSKLRVAMRSLVSAIGIRKPLEFNVGGKHYSLYKGAAWWAITPALANYVLESYDNNAELDSYFETSFCPAETFVQTVAFNSAFADRCILTAGHFTTLYDLTPLTYIDYNPVVQVLTEKYLDTLKSCGKMFCRKVCTGKSDGLMKLIDEMRA
jgi:hypothetical protein